MYNDRLRLSEIDAATWGRKPVVAERREHIRLYRLCRISEGSHLPWDDFGGVSPRTKTSFLGGGLEKFH